MLPDQNTVKTYHVYIYTFLDDLSCIQSPFDHFHDEDCYKIQDAIQLIGARFKEFGWEGDGSIGIIWLPPFVDVGIEDTWGTYIWHVKQRNNGISFLACDTHLNFERLSAQNEEFTYTGTQRMIPITIIETCVNWFTDAVKNVKKDMLESLSFLRSSSDPKVFAIIANLLFHYQGVLVRYVHEFMDECYLQVLVEAIESGNPHQITLQKSKVNVDPASYLPMAEDLVEQELDASSCSWFTIRGLISDMWKAYKREPFKAKYEMLFRSVDYSINEHDFYEIKKHVAIRNCMQHHDGCLDRDSLKLLGRKRLNIRDTKGKHTIEVWKPITLTDEEVNSFIDILLNFANHFHEHVGSRIPTRHYLTKRSDNRFT